MRKLAVLFVALILHALPARAADTVEKTWRIGQTEQGLVAYCADRAAAEEVAKEEVANGARGGWTMLVLQVQLQQCFTANVEFTPITVVSQHTSPVSEIRIVAVRLDGTIHYLLTRRKIIGEAI